MQILPATHNFAATFHEGIVSQIDPKTHRLKATIPALDELETAWLPMITPNAGGNQFYALPDVGELVMLLLDARAEGGCVLGAIYNQQDPTPVQNGEMWVKRFKNGTVISHNRESGEVVVNTAGQVTVTAGTVVITAPTTIHGDVSINGVVNIQGELKASGAISSGSGVSAPSVSAGTVSLATHTHGNGSPPDV